MSEADRHGPVIRCTGDRRPRYCQRPPVVPPWNDPTPQAGLKVEPCGEYGGVVGPVERKVPPPNAPGPAPTAETDTSARSGKSSARQPSAAPYRAGASCRAHLRCRTPGVASSEGAGLIGESSVDIDEVPDPAELLGKALNAEPADALGAVRKLRNVWGRNRE